MSLDRLWKSLGAAAILLCAGSCGDDDALSAAELVCVDGKDNDGDELIDLEDPGCRNNAFTLSELDPACYDGEDNDDDGLVDLNDPGCRGSIYNSTEAPDPACSDGKDNDDDDLVDLDDPGCFDDQYRETESPMVREELSKFIANNQD